MRERRRAARQPRATSHFFYPFFVPSVATLSQQIRRHSANRAERSGIITRWSTNTKCTPADDCELSRTLIQGLDTDPDRSFEAAHLFLARPWTATGGGRDDINCWRHFWLFVLAGFRDRNHLARADSAGRSFAVAGAK